jgi:hypothetical protein
MALMPTAAIAVQCIGDGQCYPDPVTSLPEPETLALLGVAAVAMYIARRRNRK